MFTVTDTNLLFTCNKTSDLQFSQIAYQLTFHKSFFYRRFSFINQQLCRYLSYALLVLNRYEKNKTFGFIKCPRILQKKYNWSPWRQSRANWSCWLWRLIFLLEIPALLLIGEALVNMKTHAIIF